MKHRLNRLFWTEAGRVLLEGGDFQAALPPGFLTDSAASLPCLPKNGFFLEGSGLSGRKGRYIYDATWKVLRPMGFSRPFRASVLCGVPLLVPFYRRTVAVIPQGFTERVPGRLRALALVGKSAALRQTGIHLVVCSASVSASEWDILRRGNCSAATPDLLEQLINTLDFSL